MAVIVNAKEARGTDTGKTGKCKVEKILKGSLDSIPSPSAKIQIIGWKVYFRK